MGVTCRCWCAAIQRPHAVSILCVPCSKDGVKKGKLWFFFGGFFFRGWGTRGKPFFLGEKTPQYSLAEPGTGPAKVSPPRWPDHHTADSRHAAVGKTPRAGEGPDAARRNISPELWCRSSSTIFPAHFSQQNRRGGRHDKPGHRLPIAQHPPPPLDPA